MVLEEVERMKQQDVDIMISPISRAEVLAGTRPHEEGKTKALLSGMTSLHITDVIGDLAGALLRRYAKSHGLHLGDALIGATALHHGIPIFTMNRKHFAPLSPPLRLHQPEEKPPQVAERSPRYGHTKKLKMKGGKGLKKGV